MKKYYVYRISKSTGRKEYKKAKTLNIFVGEGAKQLCWKYSKQGAKKIAERDNIRFEDWNYVYGIEEAEE